MLNYLKQLALTFKILAAIVWVGEALFKINWDIHEMHMSTPPRDAPQDWGTTVYFHRTYLEILVLTVIALLSVAPNRWFVFSPIVFCISIIIALFPFCFVLFENLSQPFNTIGVVFSPGNVVAMILIFGPLPLSFTMSFWRKRRGEKVEYT
jgi:hypothetical protein